MELSNEELEFLKQMNRFAVLNETNQGYIVETKSGLVGRTFHSDPLVNGKQRVYTVTGNLLCDPGTLKLKGFID
jgi:hypothetical protein